MNTIRFQEVTGTAIWVASAITVTEFTWEAFSATYQKPAEPGANIALDAVAAAGAAAIAKKALTGNKPKAPKKPGTISKIIKSARKIGGDILNKTAGSIPGVGGIASEALKILGIGG